MARIKDVYDQLKETELNFRAGRIQENIVGGKPRLVKVQLVRSSPFGDEKPCHSFVRQNDENIAVEIGDLYGEDYEGD